MKTLLLPLSKSKYTHLTLARALNQSGAGAIVNLASQEYWGAVDQKALKLPVVTCHFKEWRGDVLKIISFNAKKARGLMARGALRVLDTDGGKSATEADASDLITQTPPEVLVTRVTGAGVSFMAAHIAAEASGASRADALARALQAAATYVSGDTPL